MQVTNERDFLQRRVSYLTADLRQADAELQLKRRAAEAASAASAERQRVLAAEAARAAAEAAEVRAEARSQRELWVSVGREQQRVLAQLSASREAMLKFASCNEYLQDVASRSGAATSVETGGVVFVMQSKDESTEEWDAYCATCGVKLRSRFGRGVTAAAGRRMTFKHVHFSKEGMCSGKFAVAPHRDPASKWLDPCQGML